MGIKHVDYLNKSILYIDLEGYSSDFEVIDLGEKAKKLIKLGSRNEIFVLYNLTNLPFTRQLMSRLKGLMEHASLVSRRVIFGIDPRYQELVHQLCANLGISANTRFAKDYPHALNLLVDDKEWMERRQNSSPHNPERRIDPDNPPSEAVIQKQINKVLENKNKL